MSRVMPAAAVRWIRLWLLGLPLCVWPAVVAAAPDIPQSVPYAIAAWSNLQSGDVFGVTQDLDGYLWLATPNGPVRFDGNRFQPWGQSSGRTQPGRYAAALAASSQGGIWAGFSGGGGVARILRGGVTYYSPADGAPT